MFKTSEIIFIKRRRLFKLKAYYTEKMKYSKLIY